MSSPPPLSTATDAPDEVGASVRADGVHYRVWAPDHSGMRVRIECKNGCRTLDLIARGGGFFAGADPAGVAGDRYGFLLADAPREPLPDPASRYQPDGVFGLSEVVDPTRYAWQSTEWTRPPLRGRVIYELHVGAFTPEGTFRAAIAQLDALVELGVNTLELMPLGDFAGRRNWGYDGVLIFAPARCHGTPDDLRALVDAAHARGLAVVLDVVYNHVGAVGNILPRYAQSYFHADRKNMWGAPLNFSAPPVRDYFLQNVRMWLDEYRFDGLRLDAVHALEDESSPHIVKEIVRAAHDRGAFVVAEDERNEVKLITPRAEGGWGLDAIWADDFHHSTRVAVTGERTSHLASYEGTVDEWLRTLRGGWLYAGQFCPHKNAPRGTPAGHRPPEQFVYCISNHDQVGNRPLGERLNASIPPAAYRALSMWLCLAPGTPLLFMGQEWAAATPFVFFTDLPGEIGAGMAESRRKEFEHYGADYDEDTLRRMPDPQSDEAFARSKLDWAETLRSPHREVRALYRACLGLRRAHLVFQSAPRYRWTAEAAADHALGLRWRDPEGDWLLLVGHSRDERETRVREPWAKARPGKRWRLVQASNAPEFGGPDAHETFSPGDSGELAFRSPGAVLLRETADDPSSAPPASRPRAKAPPS